MYSCKILTDIVKLLLKESMLSFIGVNSLFPVLCFIGYYAYVVGENPIL